MLPPVTVSAPGKALLLGGYLVLDSRHTGLVVTSEARFHCVVAAVASTQREEDLKLSVCSPQFPADTPYMYGIPLSEFKNQSPSFRPTLLASHQKNEFIDTAIQVGLLLAHTQLGPARFSDLVTQRNHTVKLVIVANNDFYSFPGTRASLPHFSSPSGSIATVKKTGLGSSAALVTCVIAGISRFFCGTLDLVAVHAAAQLAHCLAQHKVGSGFDISSAVFGTQVYRRFTSQALETAVLSGGGVNLSPNSLVSIIQGPLDFKPFHIPPLIQLVLVDVCMGSHTPSLVSQVLKWKQANCELALQLWTQLQAYQDMVVGLFETLNRVGSGATDAYQSKLVNWVHPPLDSACSITDPATLDDVGRILDQLFILFHKARECIRTVGHHAGVPIEPEEQTQLLDDCLAIQGVIGVGIPGAGGYDAIYILHVKDDATTSIDSKLRATFAKYPNVTPLTCKQSESGLTDDTGAPMPEIIKYMVAD